MKKKLTILSDLQEFKDMPSSRTTVLTHSIHPYPAKFIPQIPHRIISEFSNERHTILDPFSGSGTSLLESKLIGRNSVGFDINPIGVLTSRVKSHYFNESQFEEIDLITDRIIRRQDNIGEKKLWIPEIPRIDHWFKKDIIKALSVIIDEIRVIEDLDIRRFFNLCLSGIVVTVSNQESETRFAAKPNEVTYSKVFSSFQRKVTQTKGKLIEISKNEKFRKSKCEVHLVDSKEIDKTIKENSIDLVITSPPYINSFDYYLYHKFRIFWLAYPENEEMIEVSEVQKKELGSRYKFSGKNGSSVDSFKNEMIDCFTNVHNVTKPGKMIFIIIGDSIVKGEFIEMDEFYKDICKESGMNFIGKTSYQMKSASRSFISQNTNNKHFSRKQTHVLVFQNGSKKQTNKINDNLDVTEKKIKYTEVSEIPKNIKNKSIISIKSNKVVELTHGLIKYPAKFIPHIPRWAIDKYTKEGDFVLDNFMGSGTTNLESVLMKRRSSGIDVNPLAILTTKVKTTPINTVLLNDQLEYILKKYKTFKVSKSDMIEFPLQEFWFDLKELKEIFRLKKTIELTDDSDVKDFFRIVLYSIIKKVSFLDESQLKVKRDHKKLLSGAKVPIEEFKSKASKSIKSMGEFQDAVVENNLDPKVECFLKSSTQFIEELNGKVDLVVSSPPYINAMNYPMFHRYELLLSGLISPEEYIEHQTEYIGTERVYSKQYNELRTFEMNKNKFVDLNKKIKNVFEKEKKRSYIVQSYFEEMKVSIEQVYKYLKKGGVYVIVCGTNQIKGEPIDTCGLLGEIGVEVGFTKELEFTYQIQKHRFKITRHSTGKKINEDKIIVLRK